MTISLEQAQTVVAAALAHGTEQGFNPLTVAVLDPGGAIVALARQDGSARVQCKVAFSGQARRAFGLENLLPPSALYRFDLEARDEGGMWRIPRANWERMEGPPSPQ